MNHQKESLPAFILLTNENLQEHLYLKAQYWLSSIVKDDVFFAPSFDMYTETIAAISTPCLPPVTPPSDLLIDHEPLFEGMVDLSTEESKRAEKRPYSSPRPQKKKMRPKSRFEQLTTQGMDWCRYCGTTEDVNWRPGPWGKRTLCNKHGCDYKGYGLASRVPRLDLSIYAKESLQDRKIPVIQQLLKQDLLIKKKSDCVNLVKK